MCVCVCVLKGVSMVATKVYWNLRAIKETAIVINFNNASLSVKCFLFYKTIPKTGRGG